MQHWESSSCCLEIRPTFEKMFSTASDLLQLVNTSLLSGFSPPAMKTAVIKPLLKQEEDVENAVFQKLNTLLVLQNCFDVFQSRFRSQHSTEAALVKVLNDIHTDTGNISLMILLDFSAAINNQVSHNTLTDGLESWVGLYVTVQTWTESSLKDRDCFVSTCYYISNRGNMSCGVPQGSILGPLLLNVYMFPLTVLMGNKTISYLNYMDNTTIYILMPSGDYVPMETLRCTEQTAVFGPKDD